MPPRKPPPRVLITRSPRQTSTLAEQLQALGAEPILIPTISISPPQTYAALDAALEDLRTFDWLVFTSANAVQAFTERRTRQIPAGAQLSQPGIAAPRVAAIGAATAQALTDAGLRPSLIPPQAIAESLAQSLLPSITPHQTSILLVRAEAARDTLPDTLRSAGAELTIAPAYRNTIPQESIPLIRALFATPANWPDAITFTSSSTASNLLTLLEAANLSLPPDDPEASPILRASIGPITSKTLRDLGYPPHVEAPHATVAALAQTLAHHLHLCL